MKRVVEIPALIDMHCHLREPGFENKETIETGTLAALNGGFGTICAMPNTNPVCDNLETLNYIMQKPASVRVLPVCAVSKNLNTSELVNFNSLKNAGAIAFSNDGLPILDKKIFKTALESGFLIMSHCEDESTEVKWQIEVFKEVQNEGKVAPKLHFCHISKEKSIEFIRSAKKEGLKITAETAPHYFTFTKNNVTENGVFKMNPPLAEESDKKAVIEGLIDGTIDVIATDHAPHLMCEKLSSFDVAPFGITGFETALALGLRLFDIDFLVEKMANRPAEILGIENKQKIKVNLDEKWVYEAAKSASKCKVSPYNGMEFKGKVVELCK